MIIRFPRHYNRFASGTAMYIFRLKISGAPNLDVGKSGGFGQPGD
jgi:hypothetical protein